MDKLFLNFSVTGRGSSCHKMKTSGSCLKCEKFPNG